MGLYIYFDRPVFPLYKEKNRFFIDFVPSKPTKVCTLPCLNNGNCTIGVNGEETCRCRPGFNGTLCQISKKINYRFINTAFPN